MAKNSVRNFFLATASTIIMLASCGKDGGPGTTPVTPPVNPPTKPVDPVVVTPGGGNSGDTYTTIPSTMLNTVSAAIYNNNTTGTTDKTQSDKADGEGITTKSGGDIPVSIQIEDADILSVKNYGTVLDFTIAPKAHPLVIYKQVKDETTKKIYTEVKVDFNSGATATAHLAVYNNDNAEFSPTASYNAAFLKSLKITPQALTRIQPK